jgi:hypothetical protein
MEEIQEKKGWARTIQISILLFIIIVSPGLSWYYLRSGVAYRKSSLAELKDYGAMSFHDWKVVSHKPITADSLSGRIVIVNIVNPTTVLGAKSTEKMNKLFEQFKDRRDVVLCTFLTQTDSVNTVAFAQKNNPKRYANYWFSSTSGENYTQLLQGLKLSQKGDFSASECPYMTYIDMKGIVKNFYDINDNMQLGRLVEHIAMKLTIDPFDTPEVKREQEK